MVDSTVVVNTNSNDTFNKSDVQTVKAEDKPYQPKEVPNLSILNKIK